LKIDIKGTEYCLTSSATHITVNIKSIVKSDEKREGGLKAGDEKLTGIADLPSIQQAYKYLVRRKVGLSKATEFKELMEEVVRFEKLLEESIRI